MSLILVCHRVLDISTTVDMVSTKTRATRERRGWCFTGRCMLHGSIPRPWGARD